MNLLKIADKFKPLFQLLDPDYYPTVDTVIITGGRYSLKSYTVSIFALIALLNHQWNVLYTRYTSMSIVDSVKPEVSDKIELLGIEGKVIDTNTHIERGQNKISFKGIKTGSKGQTANLKSLSGFNVFVNDEAEELPDFKTFKKIFYSIRSIDKRNLTILILNPTTKHHWIYTEFFEKKGLQGGDNCVKDNVMYIHSSYLDADQSLIPANILADYKKVKENNPAEYDNIIMGGWLDGVDGMIFPDWICGEFDDHIPYLFGLDFGFNDPDALVKIAINKKEKKMYWDQKIYKEGNSFDQLCAIMQLHCTRDDVIIADSADARMISQLRKYFNVKGVNKKTWTVSEALKMMQDYEHIVTENSYDLVKEFSNYTWNDKKAGIPIDGFDHLLDAGRYVFMETTSRQISHQKWHA